MAEILKRLRFVIIGAGMAGMLAGIRLKERGDHDFTIYEKGDGVGGTWRENHYPGLACDTAPQARGSQSCALLAAAGSFPREGYGAGHRHRPLGLNSILRIRALKLAQGKY